MLQAENKEIFEEHKTGKTEPEKTTAPEPKKARAALAILWSVIARELARELARK